MAGLAKITKAIKMANKSKKHGVKAGQKSLIRPSQKKSVKNGRHQEKEISKAKIAKVKKTVAAIPAGLDGQIVEDEMYDFLQEPEFDYLPNEEEDLVNRNTEDESECEVNEGDGPDDK